MGDMLRVNELTKRFGKTTALDKLTMRVPEGAIYGCIGKNGAGKTTLIKIACGLLRADSGECIVADGGQSLRKAARPRMGVIAGMPAMYADMTAEENMRAQYRILGLHAPDDVRERLALVGLQDTGRKKARHFSQGMRQKLGIAMALSGDPALVILDEPANGLDPQGMIELRELIGRLNREKHITFLISSHLLDELSRVATHYGFIDHGRMLRQATAGELAESLQKAIRMRVSDANCLGKVLADMGARYTILSDREVDVLSPIRIVQVAARLYEERCELYACGEREESLETYFLRLVGGEPDARFVAS